MGHMKHKGKDGSHKETQMVKVSQDIPLYLPGKFFSGEQQGQGHEVEQCVEGEFHQLFFFLSF